MWKQGSFNPVNLKRIFKTQRHATVKVKLQKKVSCEEKQNLHVQKYKMYISTRPICKIQVNTQILSRALLCFFHFFPTTFLELAVIKVFVLCSVDRDKQLMKNNVNVTTKQCKNFLGKKLRFKFLRATKKRCFILYLRRLPTNFRSVLDSSIDTPCEHDDVKV